MIKKKIIFLTEVLKSLNVSIRKSEIKDQLHNYYYEPDLNEFSIILNVWNIKNMIVDIPIEVLEKAPKPLLSQTKSKEYFFVNGLNDNEYQCFFCNESKLRTLTFEELQEIWSGYCILMEANDESGEINGFEKKQKNRIFGQTNILVLIGLAGIILIGVFKVNDLYGYLLSILGLILSLFLLLKEKSFFTNEIIDICKIGKKLDCEKVILSDKGKVLGFSLSEISTGFFLFLIMGFIVDTSFLSNIFPIIYLTIISIVYSTYQQIRLKTYCIICIFISLNLGALIYLSYNSYGISFSSIRYLNLLSPLLFSTLIVALIKNYLSVNEENKRSKHQLDSLIKSSLVSSVFVDNRIENKHFENEITIGIQDAKFEIILFMNPQCSKCKIILKNLPRLFSEFENQIYLRILYSGTTEENSQQKLMFTLLEKRLEPLNNDEKLTHLKNISSIEKSTLLARSNPLNSLNEHSLWSNELDLEGTPALILNGIILPSFFSIEELCVFLRSITNNSN